MDQLILVIAAGFLLGCMPLLGVMPSLGVLAFLTGSIAAAVSRRLYLWLVLLGILLFACVFVEPSPSDILFVGVIFIGLLTGAYKPQLDSNALTAVLILFSHFVLCLPGIAAAEDQNFALRYFFITFYLFFLAVFFCTFPEGITINSIARAYLAAAVFSFLAGLAGYLGFFSDLLMADEFRVKGLFKDPNVFGPFFVPAILMLADDINRKKLWKTSALLHWIAITLLTLGAIFSFSRAAWINLMTGASVYFLLNLNSLGRAKRFRLILSILLVLAIVTGILLSPLSSDKGIMEFLKERAQLQSYDRERFGAQSGGLALVLENPAGYGSGQFENVIDEVTLFKLDAHSLYVRMAVEDGVLGFLLFFTAIFYILLMLLKRHLKEKENQPEGISPSALIAILCGLLVNSLVVDTIHWRHFWFFIGISLYYLREIKKEL